MWLHSQAKELLPDHLVWPRIAHTRLQTTLARLNLDSRRPIGAPWRAHQRSGHVANAPAPLSSATLGDLETAQKLAAVAGVPNRLSRSRPKLCLPENECTPARKPANVPAIVRERLGLVRRRARTRYAVRCARANLPRAQER